MHFLLFFFIFYKLTLTRCIKCKCSILTHTYAIQYYIIKKPELSVPNVLCQSIQVISNMAKQ